MFGKKKNKNPYVVVLSFSRISAAEIAKYTIKDKQILEKTLIKSQSKFSHNDFTFFDFINDDNKVFRVIFQVVLKQKEGLKKQLVNELKDLFDCSDVDLVYKQDFDFSKYNLKNGVVTSSNKDSNKEGKTNKVNTKLVKEYGDNENVASLSNQEYISSVLQSNKQAKTIKVETENNKDSIQEDILKTSKVDIE